MPQKINNNANRYKGKGTGIPGGTGEGNYRYHRNGIGENNQRDHGNNNRDRNRQNDTNARNGDRQHHTVVKRITILQSNHPARYGTGIIKKSIF